MITVDDIVEAKRKYIIDHVMPADLSSDIKEGLAIKEEMIAKVTAESVKELSPDIDQTIELLNQSGVSKEKYSKFINGEITQVELYEKPDPVSTSVRYCVDQKELMAYKENTKVELKVPETPNQDGQKAVSIWFLIKLAGELHDMYRSKNTYWSIIPQDSTPPDVPDFVQIRFRGVVPGRVGTKTFTDGEDAMPTIDDITMVNVINNSYTYTSLADLAKKLVVVDKVMKAEDVYKLTLWCTVFNYIPESQSEVPNYTKTINQSDGDIYNFSPYLPSTNQAELARNAQEMRCYLFYHNKWVVLPKGLRVLSTADNYSFLTTKKIEFSEEDAEIQTVSGGIAPLRAATGVTEESSTGGLYCLTDQLVNTKYEDVESDVFMYMHVTATKQQEKKKKCCSKSGNCSKSSSSCDKGQTDTAIKHEPCVNKPWFNNMMDHILHSQIDPLIEAINTLGDSLKQVAEGVCPDGAPITTSGAIQSLASEAQGIANAIVPRDAEVDAACSLIMDAAESAVNSAIDSAISDFNNMVDNSMNNAISAAMNSVSAFRKLKASSNGEDPELKAIAKANQAALVASTEMMTEFSQTMCDARMMDNGNAASLEKVLASIELAKQKAAQEAEIQAAKIAAQYIKDCTS